MAGIEQSPSTFRKGEVLTAARVNQIVDSRIAKVVGIRSQINTSPTRVSQVGGNVLITTEGKSGGASATGMVLYIVSTYGDLPTVDAGDGAFGFTTGNEQSYFNFNGEGWFVTPGFFMTATPSSIGERDGDHWYAITAKRSYVRIDGTWINTAKFL